MPEVKSEQEPSIEEILESIRQIISEDGDTPQADAPAAAPVAAKAEPAPKPVDLRPAPAPQPDPEIVLTGPDADEDDDAGVIDLTDKVIPDPAPHITLQEVPDMPPEDSLLSDTTAEAATDAMAKLLAGNVAVEREEPSRVGKVTLEDMARDLMRPLIKTWLDKNLPDVIERIVAKEIEKLSRRAQDK